MKLRNATKYGPRHIAVLAIAVLFSALSWAQSPTPEKAQPLLPLEPDFVASVNKQIDQIDSGLAAIPAMKTILPGREDLAKDLVETRINRYWAESLSAVAALATDIASKQEAGYDVSEFLPIVRDYLGSLPDSIEAAGSMPGVGKKFPDNSASVVDVAMFDEQLFLDAAFYDDSSWALKRGIDAARRLGLDTTDDESYLTARVEEVMANASVFLDRSARDVENLKAASTAMPEDAEIKAKLSLANARVKRTADVMQNNIALMAFLELSASAYKRQLVSVTGEVSAESLDAEVLQSHFADWSLVITDGIRHQAPGALLKFLIFVGIVFVFVQLGKFTELLVRKAFASSAVKASALLRRMVITASRNLVIILGLLIALSQIGISLGPVLTGLGIAGFILGFALQDSLANFASGMLILVYRPYDVGDMVEVSNGVFGKVERMSLVNTRILTLDNQTLIVPNNKIWQEVIKNVTYQDIRRVDLTFGISYHQDVDVAERVLREVVEADDRVLKDPELNIRLHELGESSVNFIVRPWVKTIDYWDVYWDMTKAVKQRFDAEGISIPFPQRDVHLFAGEPAVKNFVDSVSVDRAHTHIIDNDAPSDEDDG